MTEDLSQKEILIRLMDRVEHIKDEQSEHIAYTKAKLESIEAQALKTNGRMNRAEDDIDSIKVRQEGLATRVGTGVFVASAIFVYVLNKVI